MVDTDEAQHETGDLLQAGIDATTLPSVVQQNCPRPANPAPFKSCHWSGWDLTATRLALRQHQLVQAR